MTIDAERGRDARPVREDGVNTGSHLKIAIPFIGENIEALESFLFSFIKSKSHRGTTMLYIGEKLTLDLISIVKTTIG